MENHDLFEDLRKAVNCEYISDMKFDPFKEKAKHEVVKLDFDLYSTESQEDMADYLYKCKEHFVSNREGLEFFKSHEPKE